MKSIYLQNEELNLDGEKLKQITNVFVTADSMTRGVFIRHCHENLKGKLQIRAYNYNYQIDKKIYYRFVQEEKFDYEKRPRFNERWSQRKKNRGEDEDDEDDERRRNLEVQDDLEIIVVKDN